MAFKPNFGFQRAERDRARKARKEEKLRERRERAQQRKQGEGEDAPPADDEAAPIRSE